VFFLRRPRRKAPTTVEPTPLTPEIDPPPGPTLQTYAVARVVDELPDEIAGIPDLYAILGVDPGSSDEIIRYAYRRKASRLYERRWRPGQATRQLAEVNAAYEILGKPDRRADYDRRRARRAAMEHALNGSVQTDGIATGRALPSGQRHGASRLRLVPGGGLIETVVVVAVIALALYAAVLVLSSRSLVDLSGILEITETLGLSQRRRAAPTPVPTVAPTPVSAQPARAAAAGPAPPLNEPVASFNIGDAVPRYPVNVDVIAAAGGQQTQLQTSFTLR
jgi:hypothetical protein